MHVKMKLSLCLAAGLLLSACDESNDSRQSGASGLGAQFAAMFAKDANATPVDAQSINFAPLSLTDDPYNP